MERNKEVDQPFFLLLKGIVEVSGSDHCCSGRVRSVWASLALSNLRRGRVDLPRVRNAHLLASDIV
jgi:hypothetical protein